MKQYMSSTWLSKMMKRPTYSQLFWRTTSGDYGCTAKSNRKEAVEVKPLSEFKDFRKSLSIKNTVRIVHPLSEEVEGLLVRHRPNPPCPVPFPDPDSESKWSWFDTTDPLTSSLYKLLWFSKKLWECPIRDIVLKCSTSIAAKIITSIDHSRVTTRNT